jgi:hypothetical protein
MSGLRWLPVIMLLVLMPMSSACSQNPAMPHSLEGHNDCISCHGLTTANPYPERHASREYTNEKCLKCHKPSSGE